MIPQSAYFIDHRRGFRVSVPVMAMSRPEHINSISKSLRVKLSGVVLVVWMWLF